jgi:hypothetical protein
MTLLIFPQRNNNPTITTTAFYLNNPFSAALLFCISEVPIDAAGSTLLLLLDVD